MAFSKAYKFSQYDHHYSLLCRALSHPARIAILRKIIKHPDPNGLTASKIMENLPLAQPTISNHIQYLRLKKFIKAKRKGQNVFYILNSDLPNTYMGIIILIFKNDYDTDSDLTYQIEEHLINSVKDK